MESETKVIKIKFFHVPMNGIFYLDKECYWEFKKTSDTTAHNDKHGNITFISTDEVYLPL